jgi:hypothetical protein
MGGDSRGEPTTIPFRSCGACGRAWPDWREFVVDKELRLLGFQAHVQAPESNLLVFEHRCGSSVSVLAKRLRHLLPPDDPGDPGPILYDTEACNGFCRTTEDLSACDRPCANARDRRLIRLLLNMRREDSPLRPERAP